MTLTVNDTPRTFNAPRISFSQVALMGLYNIPVFERIDPQITYKFPDEPLWAKMHPRTSLAPKDGMVFKVFNGKKKESPPPSPIKASDMKDLMTPTEDAEPVRVKVKPEALARRKAEFQSKGLPWPPHFTEEMKAAEIERVQKLVAPHEARYQAEQAAKRQAIPLTETEARLKDAYIILNLMYREMVEAGLQTQGRRMAGRLLYSVDYEEVVKKLES